jgi:hypothetical protein
LLGSARTQFLRTAAGYHDHDDEPDLGPALEQVIALLADPKAVTALAKKALESQKAVAAAQKALDHLEAERFRTEEATDKAKAEIARLYAQHEAQVAAERKEVCG